MVAAGVRRKPNVQPQFRSKKPSKVVSNTIHSRQQSLSPRAYDDETTRTSSTRSEESESSTTSSTTKYYDHDSSLTFAEDSQAQHCDGRVVSGILDGISSLCLGPISQHEQHYCYPKQRPPRQAKKFINKKITSSSSSSQRRKQKIITHPNTRRLDSKELVSERLKLFQQTHLFRPVSCDQ